jgi:dTDP-4-amino-4,6-dideoxygalactose transaminase
MLYSSLNGATALSIDGKRTGMKVEFFRHSIDDEDNARAQKVLGSIFLTSGEMLMEFEKSLASCLGSERAVGVTSCTAALHLSLFARGIEDGVE